jgi:hypothetical protein
MNSLTLLTCLMLTLGTVPPVPDTLSMVAFEPDGVHYPVYRKEPRKNVEFYHLVINVQWKKEK